MEVGVEVQVFLDRQVFIETEFLGHITDMVLDGLRMAGHVHTQDRQAAGIAFQQAADEAHEAVTGLD